MQNNNNNNNNRFNSQYSHRPTCEVTLNKKFVLIIRCVTLDFKNKETSTTQSGLLNLAEPQQQKTAHVTKCDCHAGPKKKPYLYPVKLGFLIHGLILPSIRQLKTSAALIIFMYHLFTKKTSDFYSLRPN